MLSWTFVPRRSRLLVLVLISAASAACADALGLDSVTIASDAGAETGGAQASLDATAPGLDATTDATIADASRAEDAQTSDSATLDADGFVDAGSPCGLDAGEAFTIDFSSGDPDASTPSVFACVTFDGGSLDGGTFKASSSTPGEVDVNLGAAYFQVNPMNCSMVAQVFSSANFPSSVALLTGSTAFVSAQSSGFTGQNGSSLGAMDPHGMAVAIGFIVTPAADASTETVAAFVDASEPPGSPGTVTGLRFGDMTRSTTNPTLSTTVIIDSIRCAPSG